VSKLFYRSPSTAFALLMVIAALLCSAQLKAAQSSESVNETQGTNHVVTIEGMAFSPNSLQVKIGDTITWVNNDFVPHTATGVDKSWDSKNLAKGEEFSLVVDENTVLDYFCVYHPNMVAKIELLPNE